MRVMIVGSSGAGKTTFARTLAAAMRCFHLELDSLYHQPGWTALPDDELRARVAHVAARDAWVCDGNYLQVRDLLVSRATHLVWLDLPRSIVMQRVLWRSVRRAVRREVLWNGNRERIGDWLTAEHPIRWAWSQFDRRRVELAAMLRSPALARASVRRARTPREVESVLESLVATDRGSPRGRVVQLAHAWAARHGLAFAWNETAAITFTRSVGAWVCVAGTVNGEDDEVSIHPTEYGCELSLSASAGHVETYRLAPAELAEKLAGVLEWFAGWTSFVRSGPGYGH